MTLWWERSGLEVLGGRLTIAGRDAEELGRQHGTPLYAFDLTRIEEQARTLQAAFARAGTPFRLRYALKSQREPEVLARIRALGEPDEPGSVGVDVCSPGEVLHALGNGWMPEEISYTGTNLSERDLDVVLRHGIHVNLDLVSQLRRYGRRAGGGRVGLRVNPRAGAYYGSEVDGPAEGKAFYSSEEKPTKFGIYREQMPDALRAAREHDLTIDTVHFHVGDGFLTEGLPAFSIAAARVADMARYLLDEGCPIREVNAGGGLGVPQRDGDEPLDADGYAGVLMEHLGPLGVTVACEPGDFLSKESGILLVETVTVEDRLGAVFAGTDAGFNVGPERFIYGSPLPIVLCRAADAGASSSYTVSGNINEGPDLWGEAVALPELREGDILAILSVGTYNQSMAMNHCLRPAAAGIYFSDRI